MSEIIVEFRRCKKCPGDCDMVKTVEWINAHASLGIADILRIGFGREDYDIYSDQGEVSALGLSVHADFFERPIEISRNGGPPIAFKEQSCYLDCEPHDEGGYSLDVDRSGRITITEYTEAD